MSNRAPTATLEELLAHAGWARRLARRLTADADDAEDLLQETWIAAAHRPPTSDRPLRPWLAVVLRNLWLKRKVAARRRAAREVALAGEREAASAERLAERVEGQRLLAELVAGLAEPYRQTVVLRYFDDLPGAEIARRLQIPAGTVRWRLKVALDELRQRLDERHGGRREVWTAALLPRAGPGALRPRTGWPVLFGMAGATLALGLVFTRCGGEAPGVLSPAGAPSAMAIFASRVPVFRIAGPAPVDDLAACQREVQRLRVERAALEVERRKLASPQEQFREGEPNPTAFAALHPGVARAFDRPRAPEFSLECRTWACRVVLLAPPRGDDAPWASTWYNVLAEDDVRERVHQMQPGLGNPTKDELTGEPLNEVEVFLPLRHPSGARMALEAALAPNLPDLPLPHTPRSCAAEREQLRARIREVQGYLAARAPISERFAEGAPNPKLTAEVRRRLVAAFPRMHTAVMKVECRGNVCGASWPTGPRSWPSETDRDPWFRTMIGRIEGGPPSFPLRPTRRPDQHDWYFLVLPAPQVDGAPFLRDLIDRFDRSSIADDCAARFPATGSLHVRFTLDGTSLGPAPDDPPHLSARFGHTLSGTPLGRCLQTEIETHILAAPLPQAITHAGDYRQFTFPRPASRAATLPPGHPDLDKITFVVTGSPSRR
jgi:RNA polymerase sigma factor (sigma-70 family)